MDVTELLSIFHHLGFPLEGKKLLLGVSGGADSICLLDLLSDIKTKIIVAHFNHHLREASNLDAELVQRTAGKYKFPFEYGEDDIEQLADKMHRSVEEQGRISRYEFLFKVAGRYKADAVAVAHNADDQVETILMHFLRGCGLAGLRGMTALSFDHPWKSTIPVIRPLLYSKKTEILSYCKKKRLEFNEDQSNCNTAFFRNRVRNELIPLLETYNPQVKDHLLRLGDITSADYQLLEEYGNQHWQDCVLETGNDFILLDVVKLLMLPKSQSRWIAQKVFHYLKPQDRDIDFDSVARFQEFLKNPPKTGRMNWIKNITFTLDGNDLYITDRLGPALDSKYPQMKTDSIEWSGKGNIALSEKYSIGGQVVDWDGISEIPEDQSQAWIDFDTVHPPLTIRKWKFGDRFEPLGFAGKTVKISDFWNNVHLPKRVRKFYPVIECSGQIIWLPGLRLAQSVAVSKKTKNLLMVKLLKK